MNGKINDSTAHYGRFFDGCTLRCKCSWLNSNNSLVLVAEFSCLDSNGWLVNSPVYVCSTIRILARIKDNHSSLLSVVFMLRPDLCLDLLGRVIENKNAGKIKNDGDLILLQRAIPGL